MGTVSSVVSLMYAVNNDVAPEWPLILLMIAPFFFMFTFGSILVIQVLHGVVKPTIKLLVALVLFCAGSFGFFLSALDAHYVPTSFLRIAVASAVLLVVGGLLLLLDVFTESQPKRIDAMYILIALGTFGLLAGSSLLFTNHVVGGFALNLVGFVFLLLASIVNLAN